MNTTLQTLTLQQINHQYVFQQTAVLLFATREICASLSSFNWKGMGFLS